MQIFENPFYILGVSPEDDRSVLASKVDERTLLLGDNAMDAYNTLANPAKRLSAEFTWFPGLSSNEIDQVTDYLQGLTNDPSADNFIMPKGLPLAELEIALARAQILGFSSVPEAKYAVLEISRLFQVIELPMVMVNINSARTSSHFPQLQSERELQDEYQRFRLYIKQQLSLLLDRFTENEYVSALTVLTEKYASEDERYRGSLIIGDLADAYALRIAPRLQKQKNEIIAHTNSIKEGVLATQSDQDITSLMKEIRAWDALAQPLQYVARERGQRQPESEEVAIAVRNLCVSLHNDHHMTREALLLTRVLVQCFSELLQIADRLADDQTILEQLRESQKAEESARADEMVAQQYNSQDKVYSVTIIGNHYVTPKCCTCCMKPTEETETVSHSSTRQKGNQKTTHTVSATMPLCPECKAIRKKASNFAWCLGIITVASALLSAVLFHLLLYPHPEGFWLIPFFVASVVFFSVGICYKLPPLPEGHATREHSVRISALFDGNSVTFTFKNWLYARQFARVNRKVLINPHAPIVEIEQKRHTRDNSYLCAIDQPIALFVGIAVFTVIAVFISSLMLPSLPARTTRPDGIPTTQSSNPVFTPNPATPSPTYSYAGIRRNILLEQIDALADEIEDMETSLEDMASDLEYYKEQYYTTLDAFYADRHDEIVEKYNVLYADYERAIDTYNALVEEYNLMLP